jgi:hypothetical protein
MADSDLITNQNKLAEEAKAQSAKLDKSLQDILKVTEKPADRVKLLKMQAEMKKANRTLSDDLGKNISDMKDGFTTTVDGMINQTFGPLGGMVTSLTTGIFKRGKENRENIEQNQLQNANAEDLVAKMSGVQAAVESLDKKTAPRDLDAENQKKAAAKGGAKTGVAGAAGASGGKPVDEEGVADIVMDNLGTAVGVAGGGGIVATTKALGGKYKALAGKLTGGVMGKVLSKANPVFAAALVGKDVFDIANAVTDDDVKTSVKNEDIGGVIGGILGGALGFALGGPGGAYLGASLGNMAGEFLGGAMDDPEIVGAIQTVKDGLTAEKSGLVSEINIINEKLKDKNISAEMKALYEEQLRQNKARITSIDTELEDMKVLDADIKALDEIDKRAAKNRKEKARLENALRIARENGDTARITALENMIKVTDEEFEQAEKDYEVQAEKLRKAAQKTSSELAEKSTSYFDKLATGGGAMSWLGELFGGDSLEGEAKTNLIVGEAQEDKAKMEARLEQIKKMPKSKYKERMVKGLEKRIAEKTDVIEGLESGSTQKTRIAEIEKLIKEEEDKIKRSKGGEDVYGVTADNMFGRESEGQSESLETIEELQKELGPLREEVGKMKGAARGGFIVNQPTYLPGSGVVVGEHGTYGSGLAYGGIADGGPEAVIPLSSTRAGAFIDPMAQSVAGAIMNRLQMERMSGGTGGGGATVVTDARSYSSDSNTTVINNPSPIGQTLPDEGRDFVSKVA